MADPTGVSMVTKVSTGTNTTRKSVVSREDAVGCIDSNSCRGFEERSSTVLGIEELKCSIWGFSE